MQELFSPFKLLLSPSKIIQNPKLALYYTLVAGTTAAHLLQPFFLAKAISSAVENHDPHHDHPSPPSQLDAEIYYLGGFALNWFLEKVLNRTIKSFSDQISTEEAEKKVKDLLMSYQNHTAIKNSLEIPYEFTKAVQKSYQQTKALHFHQLTQSIPSTVKSTGYLIPILILEGWVVFGIGTGFLLGYAGYGLKRQPNIDNENQLFNEFTTTIKKNELVETSPEQFEKQIVNILKKNNTRSTLATTLIKNDLSPHLQSFMIGGTAFIFMSIKHVTLSNNRTPLESYLQTLLYLPGFFHHILKLSENLTQTTQIKMNLAYIENFLKKGTLLPKNKISNLFEEKFVIEFEAVSLQEKGKNLLSQVTFKIEEDITGIATPQNRFTNIKSILFDLFTGLREAPSSGSIRFGQHNAKHIKATDITSHFSVISDGIQFSNDTLLEYLRRDNPTMTEDKILQIINEIKKQDTLQAYVSFIENLPEGLRTIINDENKIQLTEKNLIFLSCLKTLVSDKPVIIWDLPNSRYSREDFQLLSPLFLKIEKPKKLIIFTNDHQVLKKIGFPIIVFGNTQVVGQGSYKELKNTQSFKTCLQGNSFTHFTTDTGIWPIDTSNEDEQNEIKKIIIQETAEDKNDYHENSPLKYSSGGSSV